MLNVKTMFGRKLQQIPLLLGKKRWFAVLHHSKKPAAKNEVQLGLASMHRVELICGLNRSLFRFHLIAIALDEGRDTWLGLQSLTAALALPCGRVEETLQ